MGDNPLSAAELASQIERWSGIDPLTYADERIAQLAVAGDEAGLRRFTEIAARLDPLRRQDGAKPD